MVIISSKLFVVKQIGFQHTHFWVTIIYVNNVSISFLFHQFMNHILPEHFFWRFLISSWRPFSVWACSVCMKRMALSRLRLWTAACVAMVVGLGGKCPKNYKLWIININNNIKNLLTGVCQTGNQFVHFSHNSNNNDVNS